jgi:hypothetical protein
MGFAKVTDLALSNWKRIQPIAGRWGNKHPSKGTVLPPFFGIVKIRPFDQ